MPLVRADQMLASDDERELSSAVLLLDGSGSGAGRDSSSTLGGSAGSEAPSRELLVHPARHAVAAASRQDF
jgi:hypothetical protein